MNSINCDIATVWSNVMSKLKTVSMTAYTGWFNKVTPLCISDDRIIKIGVPDSFFADWIREHFGYMLENCIAECSYDYTFEFIEGYPALNTSGTTAAKPEVKQNIEEDSEQGLLFADDPLFAAEPEVQQPAPIQAAPVIDKANYKIYGINLSSLPNHTFKNFIVGEENRYAFETVRSVALNPGKIYNPLYVYGSTGVGKTHLLKAVANEALSINPNLTVRYTTCEDLVNEFVKCLEQGRKMYEFRAAMRDVDILLVDDVHTLSKKPRSQEEFFNTFNALYDNHKQIILTSDKQPCDIEGIEPRLISRFESGLTQEICPPDYETRLAILQALRNDPKVEIKVNDAILEFIAENITSNVRRLKGAFVRVTAYSGMKKDTVITTAHAEKILSALIAKETAEKTVYIEDIQRAVAHHFNLKMNDLLGNARPKNIAEPRMAAMYLCRKLTAHSLPEIGASFGKNHATIINATRKVPELCEKSKDFKRSLEIIEQQLTRR